MRVEGERSLNAPRATVWEVLNDPERMAELMPGVESFEVKDDRNWRANVKIPLGLGGLRMSIDFEKLEEREPEYAKLRAKGNGVGALLDMETTFHLSEQGDATGMRWEADVKIAGPVGSMGQRVLQPIVNQQVGNVLAALEKQVEAAAAKAAPATDPELKDAGPPAAASPEADPATVEGSSGAEEGTSPLSPDAYPDEPERR
jgi:uncharacterized protein